MPSQNSYFEESIPYQNLFANALHQTAYLPLPKNWFVVITDIQNSTKAIDAGQYRDINSIGGSSIAAVVNATKPRAIPYVFGGDGASFCVPPELLEPVKQALRGCQQLALDSAQLVLRVGIIPCHELDKPVFISRFKRTENLKQFFFMGGGLEEADDKIKCNDQYELAIDTPVKVDFSGFECRWNEIPSPKEVTFSLIVKSRLMNTEKTLALYQRLSQQIVHDLGSLQDSAPLSQEALTLSFNRDSLKIETASKTFQQGIWHNRLELLRIRLQNIVGIYWMKISKIYKGYNWGNYKKDLIKNSDFEKVDDAYRTVLSAEQTQLDALLAWLDKAHYQGLLFYGCHQTHSAIITCLITETGQDHIHFVDSVNGGYAVAAKQLKQQMAAEKNAF
ncbi:DUF3095 family protein [Thiomicrorhabdus arctica]|uniref:DUF3095 family protein n=1 Tax=Thiomicrorhabdus arctica TaxID=131540 RepID=UPI00035C1102|nr:DUF3095 family protein [Thiomicrorhabdus arctica]